MRTGQANVIFPRQHFSEPLSTVPPSTKRGKLSDEIRERRSFEETLSHNKSIRDSLVGSGALEPILEDLLEKESNRIRQANPISIRKTIKGLLDMGVSSRRTLNTAIASGKASLIDEYEKRGHFKKKDGTSFARLGRIINSLHLFKAIRAGDLDEVLIALNKPLTNVNRPLSGKFPLHEAIRKGYTPIVKAISTTPGVNLNAIEPHSGITPLVATLHPEGIGPIIHSHGRIKTFSTILDNKQTDVNKSTSLNVEPHMNPLLAAQHHKPFYTRKLLSHPDIDPNFQNHTRQSAAHVAIDNQNPDTLETLLDDPRVNPNLRSAIGFTPMDHVSDNPLVINPVILQMRQRMQEALSRRGGKRSRELDN